MRVGEQAEFTCNSFGDVQWHKLDYARTNLLPLPKYSRVNGNTLVLKFLKMEDSGCYECTGQTEDVNVWSKHYVQFTARACLAVLSKSSEHLTGIFWCSCTIYECLGGTARTQPVALTILG